MLFVLRDFSPQSSKEHIMEMIRNDINNIWTEIHKPEKFADKKASDFFELEFAFMPHKVFQPKEFEDNVAELRTRFNVGAPNSLFLEDSGDKNVPMDGLSYYMEQNWASIRSNKELNLPDQRKLVAEFRCNE